MFPGAVVITGFMGVMVLTAIHRIIDTGIRPEHDRDRLLIIVVGRTEVGFVA